MGYFRPTISWWGCGAVTSTDGHDGGFLAFDMKIHRTMSRNRTHHEVKGVTRSLRRNQQAARHDRVGSEGAIAPKNILYPMAYQARMID